MKRSERGFTLIELLVVVAILSLMVGAVSMSIFQVVTGTERSNNNMTVIRQVQNAGDWISRDAVSAQNVVVDDDPETPEFLTLTWREGVYGGDTIYYTYHSVTYSFQDMPDEIGKLQRQYLIYNEDMTELIGNTTTLVAEYIHYTGESDRTYAVYDYEKSVLTVQIASSLGEANEIKEYRVWHRSSY